MLKNLTLIVTPTKDGWFIGQIAEFPEALSQGKSLEELKVNISDALDLVISYKLSEARKNIKKEHSKTYKLSLINA